MFSPDGSHRIGPGSIYIYDGKLGQPAAPDMSSADVAVGTVLLGRYGGDPHEPYTQDDIVRDASLMADRLAIGYSDIHNSDFAIMTPDDPLATATADELNHQLRFQYLQSAHLELNAAGTWPPVVHNLVDYIQLIRQKQKHVTLGQHVLVLAKPRLMAAVVGSAERGALAEVSPSWRNPNFDAEMALWAAKEPAAFRG